MADEDVTVTNEDDVSDTAHSQDQPRKLSDYKPTNMPLSADEIKRQRNKDIGDMKPIPERPPER